MSKRRSDKERRPFTSFICLIGPICGSLSYGKFRESFSGAIEGFITFAKTKPHLLPAVLGNTVEARPGNASDPNFSNQVPRKLNIIRKAKRRNVSHDVVSAIRYERLKTSLLQNRQEPVSSCTIFALQLVVILTWERQSVGTGSLQWGGCADSKKIVDLADTARDFGWRNTITNSPTGNGIGLGHRVDYDRTFSHAFHLGH